MIIVLHQGLLRNSSESTDFMKEPALEFGAKALAEDTSLHRSVTLKLVPPKMQQDPVARKRLLRKADSTAALDHPHISRINEAGE